MNRDEYNKLFHKVGLNRVAFKAVNDCDEEILVLVNAAIAAEREWVGLTEAERLDILDAELTTQSTEHFALAQAIEAKLKEKNT
jgi:hypothetical protein